MKHTIRHLLLWIVMLAVVSVSGLAQSVQAAGGPLPTPETRTVRVGLLAPTATMTPMWVARDGGYFAKYGLDVEISMMGTAARTVAALLSGDIHVASVGVAQVINAAAGGGDVVIISDMLRQSSFRLFGAEGIESIQDLRGKRIGVPSLGSSADMEVQFILGHFGMKVPQDAQMVPIGGLPEIYAALAYGAIDAGILVAPYSFNAADDGMNLLITPAEVRERGIPSEDTKVASTRAWLARNPGTAELFMRGFLEGMHRTMTDKDFAVRVIAQNTNVDLAMAERAYDDLVAGNIELKAFLTEERVGVIRDFLIQTTDNPRVASTPNSAAIDMSILRKLDESGFIDSIGND